MTSAFSRHALSVNDSVTHGTKALIASLNAGLPAAEQVIDLSIGTLDILADKRIDQGVRDFIARDPEAVHAFAPVKGFPSLRAAIAARTERLHGIAFDPASEIIVTPGGIKGALSVTFLAFLDPGDEVIIPVPNWPHYADMIRLHGATPRFVTATAPGFGLTPAGLRAALTAETKLVILGDCINPTGKVYTTTELAALAAVITAHNASHARPVHVLFDCPYEAHIVGARATTFAALPGMRDFTISITGPGKTYGMHGDRIGYACASAATIAIMDRVQVNLNSFASTYGQAATEVALAEAMDQVATQRAVAARANVEAMVRRLNAIPGVRCELPVGGYFLWVDFSALAPTVAAHGHATIDQFLLHEARVAVIGGGHFAEGTDQFQHFARLNCGRSLAALTQACARIAFAVNCLAVAA